MKLFFRIIFKVFLVLSMIAGWATTERITERKKNEHQKYALLIGGGITESDNYVLPQNVAGSNDFNRLY